MTGFFDDLEDCEQLLCYIDPRDKDPRNEEKRQLAFLRMVKMLCPAVTVFAVPNGAKRSQWEANKARREGVKSGAPDLVCCWNRGVAFVEMKAGTTMPSPTQVAFLNTLYRQGQWVGVFRQEQSAIDWLTSIGAPSIRRAAK